MVSAARKRIQEAQHDEATAQMLLEIHKRIIEETVSMNPVFDYEGLDRPGSSTGACEHML